MKPVHWIASSKRNLMSFPTIIRREAGHSLYLAQKGDKGVNAVPMVGFGDASVIEVVMNEMAGTFRAIYTVRFQHAIYVLHAFQKKSKTGISTPQTDLDLVKRRFKVAKDHHKEHYEKINQEKQHDRSA